MHAHNRPVRFQLLGALRAWRSGAEVDLGPPQQRAVAAALVLRAGVTVSAERLIDDVWGEDPPRTAPMALRNYVYRLRRSAAGGGCAFIQSGRSGYALAGDGVDTDLVLFEKLVARAGTLRLDDEVEGAYSQYAEGLALWSDCPLAGVPGPYASAQRARLSELRLTAFEDYVDCALQLGRYAGILADLPGMVLAHPFDERLRELHMLALHGAGRQADALAVYREARRVLKEQLGTEPGVGLREAHRRVLAGDHPLPLRDTTQISVHGSADSAVAGVRPAQLPSRIKHLIGRSAEREILLAGATSRKESGPTISIVHGMPGIGKTVLAVAAAHLLAPQFPDGQLYVDLRGFSPLGGPMDPSQALADLLTSMGVPDPQVPPSVSARSALFRSMLSGRRMLLLLDNARNAEQARPLLPGAPGCHTIITSRNNMSGLIASHAAQSVPLQAFSTDEAAEFLATKLGAHRLREEPEAADLIIKRCAGLPLALATAAGRLTAGTAGSLGDVTRTMAANDGSLDTFALGSDTAMDTRAVFSWSYRLISARAARLFRLLPKHPDTDITAFSASTLAGSAVRDAREMLAELASVHLVTAHPGCRYSLHDLLRIYGTELAAKGERRAR